MDQGMFQRIFNESLERELDLMDLKRYPPFTVFDDKADRLVSYVKEFVFDPVHGEAQSIFIPVGDEIEIDTSKSDLIRIWLEHGQRLDKGDRALPRGLKQDVKKARIYRELSGNDPFKSLRVAAWFEYPELDVDIDKIIL